jgi:hypothetical protein
MSCAQVHAVARSGNVQEALSNLFCNIPTVRHPQLNSDNKNGTSTPLGERQQPATSRPPATPATQMASRPSHNDVSVLLQALQDRERLHFADATPRCFNCGISSHMSMDCPSKSKNVRRLLLLTYRCFGTHTYITAVPNHQAATGERKVLHGVWPPGETYCRACFAPVRVRQIVQHAHIFLEQTAAACRD